MRVPFVSARPRVLPCLARTASITTSWARSRSFLPSAPTGSSAAEAFAAPEALGPAPASMAAPWQARGAVLGRKMCRAGAPRA